MKSRIRPYRVRGVSPAVLRPRRTVLSRLVRVSAAAILATGAACTNANEPRGSIVIELASTRVSIGPPPAASGFVVPVTIINNSEKTVYYTERCGFNVEQSTLGGDEEPRRWMHAWSPACTLDLPTGSSLIPLAPGESVAFRVDTRGSGLDRSTPLGAYRVKFRLYGQLSNLFYSLPDDQRVSTPFTVI